MLVAIISIYWITIQQIIQLYEQGIDTNIKIYMVSFFSSFAVKHQCGRYIPHSRCTCSSSNSRISAIITTILLKMAGYGFIRFSLGLFPVASEIFTPLIYTLSVIAIIFTSLIALMQEDMKKLIAYSSVVHMGL